MIVTKQQILELSEPFEEIYSGITNQILILMSEYIGKNIDEPIEVWKEKRMKELNILLGKSRSIMSNAPFISTTIYALNSVVDMTLDDIEPDLKKASKMGALAKTTSYMDSIGINELKKNMKQDFLGNFNTMNNTMQSFISQGYNRAIQNVVMNYNQRRTQILDEAVDKLFHQTTMQKAIGDAIRQMAKEGIPAFVDKAGKKWSPEAYSSMYVRTNVHKLSIDTVLKRNEDYGNDLFVVSKHSGARPKCAPYQGKIVSNKNRSGYVKDGKGKKYKFIPLSSTSYGEPDGLLGINCGHFLKPFTPDVSVKNIKPLTKEQEKENAKVYEESQQQRAIEREIRKSKTLEEMYKNAGCEDELEKQKIKTRNKQLKMREFINKTGRTRRPDREQIVKEG